MYFKCLQFVRSRLKKVGLVCDPFPFNELFWVSFEARTSWKASQTFQSYYILLFPFAISVVYGLHQILLLHAVSFARIGLTISIKGHQSIAISSCSMTVALYV